MQRIPMLDLRREYEYMKHGIDAAIQTCLTHQKWILGSEVKRFEERIAEYLDVKHAIGVSSGTDALVLALRALAIKLKGQEYFGKGDEIITTSFTFTATGDAILRSGAIPVFVDIDPETYNLDVEKMGSYLAANSSKVFGIIPVHLYGQPCNMDGIMSLAKAHDLFVLEDVAQAFGGTWKGRKLGSIGTAGAFSFFPSKNLGGFGDSGLVAVNDDEIAELVRVLLKHGGKDKYNVEHVGYNARLDTLHAAILLAKLSYIDEFNKRRQYIAEKYTQSLIGHDGLIVSNKNSGSQFSGHVYHQYTIRVLNEKRNDLQMYLQNNGISTMVYYPFPLHKMKVFNGKMIMPEHLKNAEQACSQVLSLPMEPLLEENEIVTVIDAIKEYMVKENTNH